jgi:hypothetical protein
VLVYHRTDLSINLNVLLDRYKTPTKVDIQLLICFGNFLIEILLGGCCPTDAVGVRGGPAEVKLVGVIRRPASASRACQ